ncbi:unnamed protein product, partial [marine sediment metagenome]
ETSSNTRNRDIHAHRDHQNKKNRIKQNKKMVAVEEECIKCGRPFLRGIYPQTKCEVCSMKESHA